MNKDATVDCGEMIYEMLDLDPSMLGAMSPSEAGSTDRALLGLGQLVRRSFELSLLLRDRKSLVLRLKSSDEQARAWGFGDVTSANIGLLITWGALRAYRYCRGHRYVPLMKADEKVADLPPKAETAITAMSNEQLLGKIYDPTPYPEPRSFDEATPDDIKGASIWELNRDLLGVHGVDFASTLYDTLEEMVPDIVEHPEQLAGHGLVWFLQGVAAQFAEIRDRDVRKIQLRTDQDAVDADIPGGAKAANLMTLMAASLFADKTHAVSFLAPKERSKEEIEMLKSVARWVYLNYNSQAFDGLALLYEGNRHFGTRGRFRLAARLLHAVRFDVDPKLERMPTFVKAIEFGLDRASQQDRWRDAS